LLPFLNRDDSPGAAWGEVCFGEDIEGAVGASGGLAERSCGPFGSLSGLQPILHPDRGDIARDFPAQSMLLITKP
jgi:hypothetical protein